MSISERDAQTTAVVPAPQMGLFWSNQDPERIHWFTPVNAAWTLLQPLFNNDRRAFPAWSLARWNGANAIYQPSKVNADSRALGLATAIRDVPSRVIKLRKADERHLYNGDGQLPLDSTVEQVATSATNELFQGRTDSAVVRDRKAMLRLSQAWSTAAALGNISQFENNLAAVAFYLQLMLFSGPGFFATNKSRKVERSPKMFLLAMILSSPLVLFTERDVRAKNGHFTWATLANFCHWHHSDASPRIPDAVRELERFIFERLRTYIHDQYTMDDYDSYMLLRSLSRDLLSEAEKVFKLLQFNKVITPLIELLPLKDEDLVDTANSNDTPALAIGWSPLLELPSSAAQHDAHATHNGDSTTAVVQASGSNSARGRQQTRTINIPTFGRKRARSCDSILRQTGDRKRLRLDEVKLEPLGDSARRSSTRHPLIPTFPHVVVNMGDRSTPVIPYGDQETATPDGNHHRATGVAPVRALGASAESAKGGQSGGAVDDVGHEHDIDYDYDEHETIEADGTGTSDVRNHQVKPARTASTIDKNGANGEDDEYEVPRDKDAVHGDADKPMDSIDDVSFDGGGSGSDNDSNTRSSSPDQDSPREDEATLEPIRKSARLAEKPRQLFKETIVHGNTGTSKGRTRPKPKPKQDLEVGSDPEALEAHPFIGPIEIELDVVVLGIEPDIDSVETPQDERLYPGWGGTLSDDFWSRRLKGKEITFFGESNNPLSAVVFGTEAVADLQQLSSLAPTEWHATANDDEILEFSRATHPYGLEDAVRHALVNHPSSVLVIRAGCGAIKEVYAEVLRSFVGDMPMQCQVPGFLYDNGRTEVVGQDTLFMLHPEHFLECRRHRSMGGINWLSGTTEDDATVNFREDWARTYGSTMGGHQSCPTRQVNFVIAGNRGAYSSRHVDASGFGTVIHVRTGVKIWFLLFPNFEGEHAEHFKDILADPRTIDFKHWKICAVRLVEGDVLVMPPGVLHCVVTIEDSLTHGGHYLSDHLLNRTVLVNQQLEVRADRHTNASHNSMLQMLVARHVLHMIQPWEFAVRRFIQQDECERRALQAIPSLSNDDGTTSNVRRIFNVLVNDPEPNDFQCLHQWVALLLIMDVVAPEMSDSGVDWLPYAEEQRYLAIEKARSFAEYWVIRTQSNAFVDSVDEAATTMITQAWPLATIKKRPVLWRKLDAKN